MVEIGVNTDKPKIKSYADVDEYIQATYSPPEKNDSMICDIMAMYLLGQKILYTESKTYCEQHLNYLMLPAIFITALCTILSLVLKDYSYGATTVSALSGVNAFLLGLINYLKLDGKAEAHRTASYKFDKLHSDMVFQSGKILLLREENRNSSLSDIINSTETNVREIKETNQFIIPESVRFNFPKLYTLNVFSEVKRIQNKEMLCINELKEVINKINERQMTPEQKTAYEELRKLLTDKFIRIQVEYYDIDDIMEKELEHYRKRNDRRFQLCGWLKT